MAIGRDNRHGRDGDGAIDEIGPDVRVPRALRTDPGLEEQRGRVYSAAGQDDVSSRQDVGAQCGSVLLQMSQFITVSLCVVFKPAFL